MSFPLSAGKQKSNYFSCPLRSRRRWNCNSISICNSIFNRSPLRRQSQANKKKEAEPEAPNRRQKGIKAAGDHRSPTYMYAPLMWGRCWRARAPACKAGFPIHFSGSDSRCRFREFLAAGCLKCVQFGNHHSGRIQIGLNVL